MPGTRRPGQQRAGVAAGRRATIAGAQQALDIEEVRLDVGDVAGTGAASSRQPSSRRSRDISARIVTAFTFAP